MTAPAPARPAPASEFPVPPRSRTPRLLRRLQFAVAVVLLIGGALTAWLVTDLRADLATAPALAEQYARLAGVRHNLNTAADLAARSVLAGEKPDGERAKAASAALGTAAGLLVDAAQARPDDAAELRDLSKDVLGYAQLLGSAAGLPRVQALPLLAEADTRLDKLLEAVGAVQSRLADQAAERSLTGNGALALWPAVLLLALVVWVSWLVARLSHRVLNPGLAGAALAIVLLAALALGAQGTAAGAAEVSRNQQFTQVVTLSTAVDGLDRAQRLLSTAAVRQDWSAATERAYEKAFSAASSAATTADLPSLKPFDAAKNDLAALLGKGDWTAAARVLTTGKPPLDVAGSEVRSQAAERTGEALDTAASEPANARNALVVQLVLALGLALAGAALGVLGLARRLQEYR